MSAAPDAGGGQANEGGMGSASSSTPEIALNSQTVEPVPLAELRLAHAVLAGIGAVGLIVLAIYSVIGTSSGSRLGAFAWSWGGAIGAFLAGTALGLLFGLPNVRNVRIVMPEDPKAGAHEGGDRGAKLGYAESTNLEQVADWLTKIIIGLTLTQYEHWEARFARLAYDLTCRMVEKCGPVVASGAAVAYPPGMTVPGGFLIVGYASLGFLMAYLWMRGYFISEMEAAKTRAIINTNVGLTSQVNYRVAIEDLDRQSKARAEEIGKQQSQIDQQRDELEKFRQQLNSMQAEGLGQYKNRSPVGVAPQQMAEEAARRVREDAKTIADSLIEKSRTPVYPDDPWKTLFGGHPVSDHLELSATVKQNASNPDWFDISLVVAQLPGSNEPPNSVQYFLHPTFGDEPRSVKFGPDGRAPLEILGYSAFTVGVLADDGTLLELDLASVSGVDPKFLVR